MTQDSAAAQATTAYPSDSDAVEKAILNNMAEGVITVECDGRISTVNPAALRILGLSKTETVGRLFDRVFESSDEALRNIFSKMVHNRLHTLHEEISYTRADGQRLDLAVTTSRLDFDRCDRGLQNVIIVLRDVTAFKAIERARRKAADHLSHELTTPLAIIKASVDSLEKVDRSTDKFKQIASRIHRNVDRLIDIQAIVQQILNPPAYTPAPCALAERIRQVLDRIGREAAHRSVTLVQHLEEIQTDIVDPHILDCVVETLVKNAIEATPDEGEVIISLKSTAAGILLQVLDHGVGIPAGDEELVFDGFHHIQPTDEYSSKRPYEFNAGGKGLELLRLKVLSEVCPFDISLQSRLCARMAVAPEACPGRISSCPSVESGEQCRQASETIFSVRFYEHSRGVD